MSDQDIRPNTYSQLRSIHQNYIDLYNALYQLKTENKEELNSIYRNIKAELIDSIKDLPKNIIKNILNIIPYNNRYVKSYLSLAKLIYDEYHVEEVNNIKLTLNFLFYKEYEIVLNIPADFSKINSEYLDIQSENTIYRAIMYNDLEQFIVFTEIDGFNQNQKLKSSLYPKSDEGYSLLELCCYHGAVDCFKLLRSKFNSEITQTCLELSFLGKNPEIMSECLKYQKPDKECMRYAIISHNIDFVSFLMNEYNLNINVKCCGKYKNLDSLLVYFDQTNDFEQCFYYSVRFNIPSLCEYFLSHGANINQKDTHRNTALHIAAKNNSKETAELLLSYGANIEATTETTEFIMFHGGNFNYRNAFRQTALLVAAQKNSKETAEVLISHGANINYKDSYGHTALLIAAEHNNKETAEVLISHGANINEKNKDGVTALHIAAENNNKETAELLLSHGANINEKIITDLLLFIMQRGIIIKK
ncbi:hypothetical protein TVAG_011000 [Trichomonas vaginalis G3]|uniref:DUF3447 domain-containing protein n=1 Tax=Trichomonas vaginalis (strain ATCC PRA-98 / G3) TaxID=412133 RepID=A2DP26_TRIV3|nr:spectrin binding [Trichomonas vaginalis G3]EAY17875.1 hypothetical protein TVAG_011000 [Trichomonas vaginalis G3]KAI5489907.1 spectrin binding [Trichomonas vaginalis G3]|eukprot:XP_001330010.1 hypothetical protein [Trichomonas vaginalis G3]